MDLRPKYHFTPKENWINDPNGLCYHKGLYHLYYQYNPFAPCWGCMHWGHATSKDMLNWKHEEIALKYDNEYDKDGCFSGSAIEKDGDLHIFYTGVKYHKVKYNEYNIPISEDPNGFTPCQIHAVSHNGGFSFEKILPPAIETDSKYTHPVHVRDPKVFKTKEGFYRIVLGNTENYKNGSLIFYRSNDLYNWKFEGKWESKDFGWGWECPDFFEIDDKDILIFSPMGAGDEKIPSISMYLTGKMDFNSFNFNWECKGLIDEALDIYAPQTFKYYDEEIKKERRIMIGWIRMSKNFENNNFCGMMTIPRECYIENGKFKTFPIKEYNDKRVANLINQASDNYFINSKNNLYDIEFIANSDFNIVLFANENKKGLYITYSKEKSSIIIDRKDVVFEGMSGIEKKEIFLDSDNFEIRIIADVSVMELFINKGEKNYTATIFPLGFNIFADFKNKSEIKIFSIE